MRIDPLAQMNELIWSAFEAIAYGSAVVLAVMLVIFGALELRTRARRARAARGRDTRGRNGRVAAAAR